MVKGNIQLAEPVVSVIMPAYNAERFIEEAIQSVMEQTFTNWELLVLDDCSKDSTCAIVERLADQDKRIRLIHNEKNMGVAYTRNRGFDLCRGSYVALLDSDDVWHPDKLTRQVRLANNTGAEIVYCSYGMIDEHDEKICDDFIVPDNTDFDQSLIKSVISCSTALLSRKIVNDYRFTTDYYHEDLALWLRLLRDGFTACGITDVLADYRVIEGTRASNKLQSAVNRWRIYRDYLGMSVSRSVVLIAQYAFMGIRKYRRCANHGVG